MASGGRPWRRCRSPPRLRSSRFPARSPPRGRDPPPYAATRGVPHLRTPRPTRSLPGYREAPAPFSGAEDDRSAHAPFLVVVLLVGQETPGAHLHREAACAREAKRPAELDTAPVSASPPSWRRPISREGRSTPPENFTSRDPSSARRKRLVCASAAARSMSQSVLWT